MPTPNNNWFKLSFREVIWVVLIVVGVIAGYARLQGTADANTKTGGENSKKIEEITGINNEQNKEIGIVQNDIQTIKEDVKEIKTSQQENQKLLHRILGKLEDGQ